MSLFSQRRGLKSVKAVIQVDSIDAELRNALWDAFHISCWPGQDGLPVQKVNTTYGLCTSLWHRYFKEPVDTIPSRADAVRRTLWEYFFGCKWYEVVDFIEFYDFIEFVANNYPDDSVKEEFIATCNSVLERELSAYCFVGARITEITSEMRSTKSRRPLIAPLRCGL